MDFAEGELRIQRSLQKIDGIHQFLETKNQSSRRTLPLYSRLTAVLKAHWERQANERLAAGAAWLGAKWGDLIFTNEIGEPLSGFTVSRRFRKLLKLAELSDMTYNECRNGTATLLAALGVPDRIAMEIAGHSQIGTTMNIYARVASEDMKEAIDKLGSELWGAVA